ncbi:MAG: flagellar hook-associated protein FlgL [Bacteriovoracaceae bacterium]
MSRVSENSQTDSLKYTLNRAKKRVEDLQSKSASLSQITRPSDNPVNNVEALQIISRNNTNNQYIKNADFANLHLNTVESSLAQISEILVKAKEIAIGQASDFYGKDVRGSVAEEVVQLRNQILAIGNKRLGNRYIFSGHKTSTPPFDADGKYHGDSGKTTLEVSKDFYIPINLSGDEVFFVFDGSSNKSENPLEDFPEFKSSPTHNPNEKPEELQERKREIASLRINPLEKSPEEKKYADNVSIIGALDTLASALRANDTGTIQVLLNSFDNAINRVITLRTKVGSLTNSVNLSKSTLETEIIDNEDRKSKLVDADVAELFSDLQKQSAVLDLSYKASQKTLNRSLMNFIN